MTTLDIAIVVVALLVVLTFLWSMRSERNAPVRPRRRRGIDRGREERDLF
jgi:hypothetical protein